MRRAPAPEARTRLDVKAVGGWLCLLATLALASPGVKAVRAEEAAEPGLVSELAPGPVCESPRGAVPGGEVEAVLDRWRVAALVEAARMAEAGAEDADAPVVLDNRGYNHRSTARIDLERALRSLREEPPR